MPNLVQYPYLNLTKAVIAGCNGCSKPKGGMALRAISQEKTQNFGMNKMQYQNGSLAHPKFANSLKILGYAVFAFVAILWLGGCFCDSIEPWLLSDSIKKRGLGLEGEWNIINDDFKDKYSIKLEKKKDKRSIDKQSFYFKISPRKYNTRFNFIGEVHEINHIKFVQITNFSHYHADVFSLANRPTVSLWQIAYDEDNIILWAPSFLKESVSTLKTMQDSKNKILFIDTTENLQNFLTEWTKNYPKIKDSIRMMMPIILSRKGTEFKMPKEMQDLVPRVYERYLKNPPVQGQEK